jgi:hypothetical protein
MAGENHPILPRPGIDDLIDLEQGRARTRINDDVLLQRAQRVAERQTRNNRAINQLRAEKNLDVLAVGISDHALDTFETDDQDKRGAKVAIVRDIKNTVQEELEKVYTRRNQQDEEFLRKMHAKQSEYGSKIAWKLRHGFSFNFFSPSTWIPYWGEVSEEGFKNKTLSVGYNLTMGMFSKSYYRKPAALAPGTQLNIDRLITEAVEEISNKIR